MKFSKLMFMENENLDIRGFFFNPKQFSILFYIILFHCILFFSIQILNQAMNFEIAWKLGSFHIPFLSIKNEWMRFFTGSFHHFNFIHLFLNMLIMFLTGSFLERVIGYKNFFILYFFIGLGSSLCSYYLLYMDLYEGSIESFSISSSVSLGLLLASFKFLNLFKKEIPINLYNFLYNNFYSLFVFYFCWIIFSFIITNTSFFDYGALLGSFISAFTLSFVFEWVILHFNFKWLDYFLFYTCLILLLVSFSWMFYFYVYQARDIIFWLDYFK